MLKACSIPLQVLVAKPSVIENAEFEAGTGILVDSADFHLAAVYIRLLKQNLTLHSDVELLAMNISRAQLDSIDASLSRLDLNHVAIGEAAAEMLLWRKAHPEAPVRRLMIAPQADFR